MNSIKKLQEYIRGAKVIQTIETIGRETVKTLKFDYYYPDYIETYEDKQKYILKCDVAILKIQYKNLNKKLEINDLIHFGLLLSIYCKKQFLSDDESILFIEEIWKFVLEFINENKILVDKDIDRVNNEKFAMQGIFKYVKYKIDTGKIDNLKEVCNYFASNKLRVNDQVTQFYDLLRKLNGKKTNKSKIIGAK